MPEFQTGYPYYLTVTERSEVQCVIKEKIRWLTYLHKEAKKTKRYRVTYIKRLLTRKSRLARVYGKMEFLEPKTTWK